ncbi:hypothetical protein BP6252_09518 [Coleophoma cylindrospora]|uniref:Phytanoyl-CoA dioxygenase n=1 Tax=Coleophoma cylindrospora TaxID=1849047 RepID=A0A3D8R245_9HELO|nr:hypothetical protein BP6252_09518 [Coleophoma cylindrospora]
MPHAIIPNVDEKYGDWRDELFQDGFAVVKGAVPADRAAGYVEEMTKWLERFPLGFDRNDPSTWTEEHLPANMKGGMYHGYAVAHEKFVWDARMEPGVVDAFAKIWGTDELLVSFDGINMTLPLPDSTRPKSARWPHQDQDSRIRGFGCAQGIINLADNGPEDGGLMVMKGSHRFNDEFFKTHSMDKKEKWGKVPDDWHGFDDDEIEWFEERGCELMKVNAKAGDLLVWDSRTVHYNILPTGKQTRAVIYACYTPAALATPEGLAKKKEIFENRDRTTHWPHRNFWRADKILRFGKEDPYHRDRPFEEPVITDRLLKLAGAMSY